MRIRKKIFAETKGGQADLHRGRHLVLHDPWRGDKETPGGKRYKKLWVVPALLSSGWSYVWKVGWTVDKIRCKAFLHA